MCPVQTVTHVSGRSQPLGQFNRPPGARAPMGSFPLTHGRMPQQEACGFQTLRQDPLFIRTLPPSAKDASGDAPPNP